MMKRGSIDSERTQFHTRMVNGKAQIHFDAIEESPVKSKGNNRPVKNVNARRAPEPTKSKPPPSNPAPQPATKATRPTPNADGPPVGVYMTMNDIAELVKAVKETASGNAQNHPSNNTTVVSQEPSPPEPQQQYYQAPQPPLEAPVQPLAPVSPRQEALGMMADRKRQKWMRDKVEMDRMKLEVEYDQLKHQLSPMHQKASSTGERSAFPSNNRPPLPPSGRQPDVAQDNASNDPTKTRLMEKKQQQWREENADKAPLWNPFGRPGAGAPNANELPSRNTQAPATNVATPYRPADNNAPAATLTINDQTRVPAAMRTNLLFGDVRFEDDVKSAKELERRQWLDDLQKQIEENKRTKVTQQETERREDFLHDSLQPLMQEAAHRQQQREPAPAPTKPPVSNSGQDTSKSKRHDSVVQETYSKILEATELAKYEKKALLIEKLKRNGHKTDLLAKTLPDMHSKAPAPTPKSIEKPVDSSPKKSTSTKIEPLHLNTAVDTTRDEAVNTMDSTFRSDHSVQTDHRMAPQIQIFSYTREESDLPPQVPQHLVRDGRNSHNKKTVRIRSVEDTDRQRRPSIPASQLTSHRSRGPIDIVHRPLWNYHNPEYREFVPNSKRYPVSDKRQRNKSNERAEEAPKKATYTRWNSDTELQQHTNRARPPMAKGNAPRDDSKTNVQQRPARKDAFALVKTDDHSSFSNLPSLDKYEHFIPYTRTQEVLDPSRAYSPVPQSREGSAGKKRSGTITYDQQHRSHASIQPPSYHMHPARQDHILQQLTAIKENLVRRQQEVTSSMNAIPV